jgi:hypothetical protein
MELKDILTWKNLIIFLIVIGLGLFVFNQMLHVYFKIHMLEDPCSLCEQLNPHIEIDWSNISNITFVQ